MGDKVGASAVVPMGGGSETKRNRWIQPVILGVELAELSNALDAGVRPNKEPKRTPDWGLEEVGRYDAVYGGGEAGGGASVRSRSGAQF